MRSYWWRSSTRSRQHQLVIDRQGMLKCDDRDRRWVQVQPHDLTAEGRGDRRRTAGFAGSSPNPPASAGRVSSRSAPGVRFGRRLLRRDESLHHRVGRHSRARVAAGNAVFIAKPLEHPLRGVPLFAVNLAITLQEGQRWTTIAPPAAVSARLSRGHISHCRSHSLRALCLGAVEGETIKPAIEVNWPAHFGCSAGGWLPNKIIIKMISVAAGGERGIRTLETVSRLHTFQACAFDHSATSPQVWRAPIAKPSRNVKGLLIAPHTSRP